MRPGTRSARRGAATIDSILRVSGYVGFLSNLSASTQDFDKDYDVMSQICALLQSEPPMTAGSWAVSLLGSGLLTDRLLDRRGEDKNRHAMATIVGQLFNRYVGSIFTVEGQRFRLRRRPKPGSRSHESPTYWFEAIDENAEGRRGGGGRDAADPQEPDPHPSGRIEENTFPVGQKGEGHA